MATRFYQYSKAKLATLQSRIEPSLQQWSREWFGAKALVHTMDNATTDALLSTISLNAAFGLDEQIYVFEPDSVQNWVTSLLTHTDTSSMPEFSASDTEPELIGTINDALVHDAMTALLDTVNGETVQQATAQKSTVTKDRIASQKGAAILRSGSAWVFIQLTVAGVEVLLLLGPAVISRYLPIELPAAKGDLDDRRTAIKGKTVTLTASLGRTRLTIGEVSCLQLGDIVSLDQTIGSSLDVLNEEGVCAFRGRVVQHQGNKAILVDANQ